MKALHYHGGWRRPGKGQGKEHWTYENGETTLFLQPHGFACQAGPSDAIAVLIRGQAHWGGSKQDIIQAIRDHYRLHGQLPVERLEGNFTILILDGPRARILLYRSLASNGFTYYTQSQHGFRFGSNLADLVETSGSAPQPNDNVLPAYFLYRFVPGRETLFDGFYRLMPGELLTCDADGLRRTQLRTFADLRGTYRFASGYVEEVEETFGQVMRGYARTSPRTANLLSGGVDSSYLQAIWNQVARSSREAPVSFSVSVSHPLTRRDSNYAMSMSQVLGTSHTFVPADEPYIDYLIDSIAATGEPPNHVFAPYFGHLARIMADRGFMTGLCGEGADSLFGIGTADELRKARVLRALVPSGFLRRRGGVWAAALGWQRLAHYLDLAERLNDIADLDHPVNQVAAFADWSSVEACFGKPAVRAACQYRRGLLEQYRVPNDVQEQLHACGYLGEAIDSASLWTTLCNRAGVDLFCPFLDSRVLRLALSLPPNQRFPCGQPKGLLKQVLARHVPPPLVYRKKLGFGQPIFEWLSPGGSLRSWVERIGDYAFVPPKVRAAALARPNWFLYSLLCYDIWHQLFIEQTLPHERPGKPTDGHPWVCEGTEA